jgi:hypothetical protein
MSKRISQPIKSAIKNYSLIWRRDSVRWKQSGVLCGRRSGRVIDFRGQIGVYVLYDEGRHPVYVGQTGQGKARLFSRLFAHTKDSLAERWRYFSWFGLLRVNEGSRTLVAWDDKSTHVSGTIGSMLNEIKGVLIAATTPEFNKQGAKFKGIARYRQIPYAEPEVLPARELRKRLSRIEKQLARLTRL